MQALEALQQLTVVDIRADSIVILALDILIIYDTIATYECLSPKWDTVQQNIVPPCLIPQFRGNRNPIIRMSGSVHAAP